MRWDPRLYAYCAPERARPFADLLARVTPTREPRLVVDLGCGPGDLTASLAERWMGATVIGVDSSPEMIAAATRLAGGGLDFALADLRAWVPPSPVDIMVANASLHWVPSHPDLLPTLVDRLAPGGTLAVQIPRNFDAPSHVLLHELRNSPPWRARIGDAVAPDLVREADTPGAADYLDLLSATGCAADVWETVYHHVLPGPDPVLEWMRGAGARPTLAALTDEERPRFEADYAALLREAYPVRAFGTVLPFRRVFAVAHAPAGTSGRTPAGASGGDR